MQPGQTVTLRITHADQRRSECPLRVRVDTPLEAATLRDGGILPHVLRELLGDVS